MSKSQFSFAKKDRVKHTHTHIYTHINAHVLWACVRPRGCWEEWRDVTLCFSACWFWMWPISEAERHRVWEWRRRRRRRERRRRRKRRRGSTLFHRESLWLSSESERGERKKWGRVRHNEHNDKQKNFSVICGCFPLTSNSVQRLDTEPLKDLGVYLFYDPCYERISLP